MSWAITILVVINDIFITDVGNHDQSMRYQTIENHFFLHQIIGNQTLNLKYIFWKCTVEPHGLMCQDWKPRGLELNYHSTLKFYGRPGSTAAETPVKFQSDRTIISRCLHIWRDFVIRRLTSHEWIRSAYYTREWELLSMRRYEFSYIRSVLYTRININKARWHNLYFLHSTDWSMPGPTVIRLHDFEKFQRLINTLIDNVFFVHHVAQYTLVHNHFTQNSQH